MKEETRKNFDYVKETIKTIIVEYMNETEQININDLLNLDELEINSIDALELLILIEQEFCIEIGDEDLNMEMFSNLDYLTGYVLDRISDSYFNED